MSDATQILTPDQVSAHVLSDWQQSQDTLQAVFATGDFATGLALVDRIGEAAEAANHHPDLTLTYPTVAVTLTSHDVGGITRRDIDMARRISELAAEASVQAASGT